MIQTKQALDEKQQLIPHFKNVTRSWDMMKEHKEMYGRNLNVEYFGRRYPNYWQIFQTRTHEEKSRSTSNDSNAAANESFLNDPIMKKHGVAVTNFLEAVIEFVNGNEDSKPVLYALGRSHKDHNVTEKMFLEMKSALIEVFKPDIAKDQWKSWDVTLDYIYFNYVFKGMHIEIITPFQDQLQKIHSRYYVPYW